MLMIVSSFPTRQAPAAERVPGADQEHAGPGQPLRVDPEGRQLVAALLLAVLGVAVRLLLGGLDLLGGLLSGGGAVEKTVKLGLRPKY